MAGLTGRGNAAFPLAIAPYEAQSTSPSRAMPAVHPPSWLPLAVHPLGNGYYDVNSKSVAGVTYRVDLVWDRCSCPDWTCRRSKASLGSKERRCIHILIALAVPPDDQPATMASAA